MLGIIIEQNVNNEGQSNTPEHLEVIWFSDD